MNRVFKTILIVIGVLVVLVIINFAVTWYNDKFYGGDRRCIVAQCRINKE